MSLPLSSVDLPAFVRDALFYAGCVKVAHVTGLLRERLDAMSRGVADGTGGGGQASLSEVLKLCAKHVLLLWRSVSFSRWCSALLVPRLPRREYTP